VVNGHKFRKRPIVIQARRFQNYVFTKREWLAWCGSDAQIIAETMDSRDFGRFCIGAHEVMEADWVIREKSGDFSVCSPSAFVQEFEPAYG
jgi:hypothetical protein